MTIAKLLKAAKVVVKYEDTVAKGQATIRCTADGAAVLASDGDSPTLWRAAGGG